MGGVIEIVLTDAIICTTKLYINVFTNPKRKSCLKTVISVEKYRFLKMCSVCPRIIKKNPYMQHTT